MNPTLRIYVNDDVTGVELGGALKNVIALAAGTADGLGLGDNSKAALMTRGITEIARLGVAMGASTETFAGLSGIGEDVYKRQRPAGAVCPDIRPRKGGALRWQYQRGKARKHAKTKDVPTSGSWRPPRSRSALTAAN